MQGRGRAQKSKRHNTISRNSEKNSLGQFRIQNFELEGGGGDGGLGLE